VEAAIKWPNDVWIEGRKVSGILVEARPDQNPDRSWVVVGIGLNTSIDISAMPEELQETATSLGLPAANDALPTLLARLDHWLGAEPSEIVAAWTPRDALLGREISWDGGEGMADGIDGDGNLLVKLADGGRKSLGAGEVHLRLHN
jgi:BirA family biotin operon repressor/biotin-[acetyl-CoA-carboxylase] ligase